MVNAQKNKTKMDNKQRQLTCISVKLQKLNYLQKEPYFEPQVHITGGII